MKLGFIGTGNMAGAIAAGIIQKGLMKQSWEASLKKESFLQKRSLDQILWKREEIM